MPIGKRRSGRLSALLMEVLTLAGSHVAIVPVSDDGHITQESLRAAAAALRVHEECVTLCPLPGGRSAHCVLREPRPPLVSLVSPDGRSYGAPRLSGPVDCSRENCAAELCASLATALAEVCRSYEVPERWSLSVQPLTSQLRPGLLAEVYPLELAAIVVVEIPREDRIIAAQLCLDTGAIGLIDSVLAVESEICDHDLFKVLLCPTPDVFLAALGVWLDDHRSQVRAGHRDGAVGAWLEPPLGSDASPMWSFAIGTA